MMTVADLLPGDLVETQEGFHLIMAIEEDKKTKCRRIFVFTFKEELRSWQGKKPSFYWQCGLRLYDPGWDGNMDSRFVLRFFRAGERLK